MTTDAESIQNLYTSGQYEIDADRSSISFQGRSLWGMMPVRGRFDDFAGTGRLRGGGEVTGQLVIDVPSLRTGMAKRDRHLTSQDFFHADRYPIITFTLAEVRFLPSDMVVVEGSLQVKDVVKQVSLSATLHAPDSESVHIGCRKLFDRTEFDISANQLGMVSNEVVTDAQLRWTRSD